jgi:hypothetical protein
MLENKEITALFKLLDDPDEEIFGVVSDRLAGYGQPIIPHLEHLWENSIQLKTQERIEKLIQRLHFESIRQELLEWDAKEEPDLLTGAILISRFHQPDLIPSQVYKEIEKIRRTVWLELNNYLTPLEQVNVLNSILFNYFHFKGSKVNYEKKEEFLLHSNLDHKKGNTLSNGILYLILSEMLDISVKAVNIPQQFILGYYSLGMDFFDDLIGSKEKPEFFIDPMSGHVFTEKEVEEYLNRLNLGNHTEYYHSLDNRKIIISFLKEFLRCHDAEKETIQHNQLKILIEDIKKGG